MATNVFPAMPSTRRFTRRRRAVDPAAGELCSPAVTCADEAELAAAPPPVAERLGQRDAASPAAAQERIQVSTFSAMRGSTLVAGLVILSVTAILLLSGQAMQFDNWPADPSPAAPDRAPDLGPRPGSAPAATAPPRSGAELIRRRDRQSASNVMARPEARGDTRTHDVRPKAGVRTPGHGPAERPTSNRSGPLTAPPGAETAPLTGGGASGGSSAIPAPASASPPGQPRPGSPAAQPGG